MATHLRIEGDVETTLTGENIANVLRSVARDYGRDYSPDAVAMLNDLADTIEQGHRPAPDGTRGTLRTAPGDTFSREGAANLVEMIVAHTRNLTVNPGEMVEFQVSVVIASKPASEIAGECSDGGAPDGGAHDPGCFDVDEEG
ncbi:MAG: hypothetical protein EPO40_19675 [Myxococcaceae bacterium]|nr:MAG: hypothetical protein EPO40_19675 [Myxococcaceae bacterium]